MKTMQRLFILASAILICSLAQAQYSHEAYVISQGGGITTGGIYENFSVIGEPFVHPDVTGGTIETDIGFIFILGGPTSIVMHLKIFLEGLYAGGGSMYKAQDEFGDHWSGIVADKVTASIASPSSPYGIVYSLPDVDLTTAGNISVSLPNTYSGSYYVVLEHRNSIETWSAAPISFGSGTVDYDFSNDAAKAYGSNMQLMEPGIYAIFAGDANQDDVVDSNDLGDIDNDSGNFIMGYVSTDVNGDGVVDTNDLGLADNNANNFVMAIVP